MPRHGPRWATRTDGSVRRLLAPLALLAALPLSLAACGGDRDEGDTLDRPTTGPDLTGTSVTVGSVSARPATGSAPSDREALLSELYAQALEARGATVERAEPADRTEVLEDLTSGAVTVAPELTGSLLAELDAAAAASGPQTVADQLTALGRALPPEVILLTPSSANVGEAVACEGGLVEEFELVTRADLERVPPDRAETACREVTGADPELVEDGLEVLIDGQLQSSLDAVVPAVHAPAATPALQAALDPVSSTLDTAALRVLVAQVTLDGDDVADVAARWLDAAGLS